MVSLNEMMDGAWIEGEQLTKLGSKFIEQLADLMSELHTMWGMDEYMENLLYRKEWILNDMHDVVYVLEPVDDFTENAILEFHEIKHELNKYVPIHGDLWRQNIRVDESGNLNGIIDWDKKSFGDPHWDFRMIRRWVGWDGLDELLFLYNCSTGFNCKREYIEVLDKISLCHSIKIRKERGLLRHDKSDAIELFENYKKFWPNISFIASQK